MYSFVERRFKAVELDKPLENQPFPENTQGRKMIPQSPISSEWTLTWADPHDH
jgi:hypothetical protein